MQNKNKCPVCQSELQEFTGMPEGYDANEYSCPRCGNFRLSRTLVGKLLSNPFGDPSASAKISHALRLMQTNNQGAEMSTNTVEEVLKRPLPSPSEQAGLLVRWIAENVDGPGEAVEVNPAKHGAIIGSKTDNGFMLVLRHLSDVKLVSGNTRVGIGADTRIPVTLSFKGWEHYESLLKGGETYRKAFMAMKFGDPDLDKIVDEVFREAVQKAGFELIRLDDSPRAGLIDDRLRVEIQSSDFLIADLTHDNLGAYWEAGYAEGLGKPVVYTCEKTKFDQEKTHFDTNHHLTVTWDKDAPNDAAEDLKATIRATLPELARQQDE